MACFFFLWSLISKVKGFTPSVSALARTQSPNFFSDLSNSENVIVKEVGLLSAFKIVDHGNDELALLDPLRDYRNDRERRSWLILVHFYHLGAC